MATPSEDFANRFNQALGNYTGRQAKAITQPKVSGETIRKSALISGAGKKKLTTGSSKKKTKKPKSEAKIADNPVSVAMLMELMQGGGIVKTIEPKGVGGFLTKHFVDPAKDLASPRETLGRVADVASRPLYALTEGTRRFIEAASDEGNPFTALDDVLSGVGGGLGGYQKTGFSDVNRQLLQDLEHIPNPSLLPARDYVQEFLDPQGVIKQEMINQEAVAAGERAPEPLVPWQQKEFVEDAQALQWLGLSQDIWGDPLNLVGAGVVKPYRQSVQAFDFSGVPQRGIQATRSATDRAIVKALGEVEDLPSARKVTTTGKVLQDTTGKFKPAVSPTEIIKEIARTSSDELSLEIGAGQQKWRTIGAKRLENNTVAARSAIAYRDELLTPLERDVKIFFDAKAKNPNGVPVGLVNKLAAKNPLFAKFINEAVEEARRVYKEGAKLTADKAIKKASGDIYEAALKTVRSSVDTDVQKFYSTVADDLNANLVKTGGIKFGDKPITVGGKKVWAKVDAIGDSIGESSVAKAFSYERNFPGLTGQIAAGSRTEGLRLAEDLKNLFFKEFPKLSIREEKTLQRAMRSGQELSGKLGEAQQVLRSWYRRLGQVQVDQGIRTPDAIKNPNYVFEYFKGNTTDIAAAKKVRKELLRADEPILDWGAQLDATKAGQKVPKRMSGMASQNLTWYIQDTMRKIIKQDMRNRTIKGYGVKATDLSKEAMDELGLVKIPDSWMTSDLAQELQLVNKGQASWYVDGEAFNVLQHFDKWTKNGFSPESQFIVRQLDKLTTFFKKYSTIYFPGFHMRNVISDYLTGFMDGVRMSDWEEVGEKLLKVRKNPDTLVNLGAEPQLFSRFKAAYDTHAGSAGFFRADLPLNRRPLWKKLGAVDEGIRGLSEGREDIGRMAHFLHAMREEYPIALSKYKNDLQAWDKAGQAAAYRVNRYHADYGALTPFEQTVMRRTVPFYTWVRRMMPVMVEAMFMNPNFMTAPSKLERNFSNLIIQPDEEAPPSWYTYPEWMREIGYSPFSDGANPWGIALNSILPSGIVGNYFGGSPRDNIKNIVGQTNPVARTITDFAYGQDLFRGQENKDIVKLILGSFRPYSTYGSLQNPTVSTLEKVLRTGLGLPVYQMTDARKNAAKNENLAAVQEAVDGLNDRIEPLGFGIYLSNQNAGQKIKIVRRDEGGDAIQTIYEGTDVSKAAIVLERIINGS